MLEPRAMYFCSAYWNNGGHGVLVHMDILALEITRLIPCPGAAAVHGLQNGENGACLVPDAAVGSQIGTFVYSVRPRLEAMQPRRM